MDRAIAVASQIESGEGQQAYKWKGKGKETLRINAVVAARSAGVEDVGRPLGEVSVKVGVANCGGSVAASKRGEARSSFRIGLENES